MSDCWEWWCPQCRGAYAPCWRELHDSVAYGDAWCWERGLPHAMVRRPCRAGVPAEAPCCHCPEPVLVASAVGLLPSRCVVTDLATGSRREVVVWACGRCGEKRAVATRT